MFPLFFFTFIRLWAGDSWPRSEVLNTTRKKTFEVIVCSAKEEVVLPKGSPRNVTFWSLSGSA